MNGLLGVSSVGTVLQQAVTALGSCRQIVDRYIHDYTHMVYAPHSILPDEELKVFRIFTSYQKIQGCSDIYNTKASSSEERFNLT